MGEGGGDSTHVHRGVWTKQKMVITEMRSREIVGGRLGDVNGGGGTLLKIEEREEGREGKLSNALI